MSAMKWYDFILALISILMIVIVVLQSSKEDASKAFSGEKSDLFANQKQRGVEKVINQATTVLSILFFIVAIVVAVVPRVNF